MYVLKYLCVESAYETGFVFEWSLELYHIDHTNPFRPTGNFLVKPKKGFYLLFGSHYAKLQKLIVLSLISSINR